MAAVDKKRISGSLRYVGDGDYILGVPARDLTKDEFEALSEAQKKQCKESGLYVMPGKKEAKDA